MHINLWPVALHIRHFYPQILLGVRVVVVACLFTSCAYLLGAMARLPVHPLAKVVLAPILVAAAAALGWLILQTEPLLVAKLALVVFLVIGALFCLYCLSNVGRWHEQLHAIQQECELATNLTYLQGEMTRAQLEALNVKIRHAIEPEEREITETLLKTISPFVTLYFRKEKSIIKWSLAAAGMGKNLLQYFWSPSKH